MFIKKVTPFIDRRFKEGGMGPDGFDCMGVTVSILKRLGKKPPESFGELNTSNYWVPFKDDEEGTRKAMAAYFDSFAARIEPAYCHVGDIVICEVLGKQFCGIFGGNAVVISVIRDGRVMPIRIGSKINIVKAWRA